MNLKDMASLIIEETSLVIKRSQIERRLRQAITAIHASARFAEDVDSIILPTPEDSSTNFAITAPTRLRAIKRLAPCDLSGNQFSISTQNNAYQEAELDNMRNYYGGLRKDTYFFAGTSINIYSSIVPPAVHIQYYASPDISDPLLETWIMREYPDLVMDWALARFYKTNGKADIASSIEATLYSIDLANLINNHATPIDTD